MATTMGQIIKKLRKGRGFTQEELAERLGVTYQAISKWENDSGMPDISQIVPLASIFDVSTDFLFGIDNTSETEEALKIVSSANSIQEYGKLDGGVRYNALKRANPEKAAKLFAQNEKEAMERYAYLKKLVTLYGEE